MKSIVTQDEMHCALSCPGFVPMPGMTACCANHDYITLKRDARGEIRCAACLHAEQQRGYGSEFQWRADR